jgi:hypothetical protein
MLEASVLYGRKEYEKALNNLRMSNADNALLHAQGIVLAAIPGRRGEAQQAFDDAFASITGWSEVMPCLLAFQQLLGPEYISRTKEAALVWSQRFSHRTRNTRDGWYHKLLAFQVGIMEAKELNRHAGESRLNQCEADFYIGLRELAAGKRSDAKMHFTSAVNTGVFTYLEYWWGRAFLTRIDDPDWMPWLQPGDRQVEAGAHSRQGHE